MQIFTQKVVLKGGCSKFRIANYELAAMLKPAIRPNQIPAGPSLKWIPYR